jgi:hypothetical protein
MTWYTDTCEITIIAVMPLKLTSANPVESLAIYPFKPTCDQTRNHPYKNVKVKAREGE